MRWFFKKPPPPPEEPLWAFWKYDHFPFLLSGRVIRELSDGTVQVGGYGGYSFKPLYLRRGVTGEDLDKIVRRLAEAYGVQQQCARNGAGQVALERLKMAGWPEEIYLPLVRPGWQGQAYQDLFREQLK